MLHDNSCQESVSWFFAAGVDVSGVDHSFYNGLQFDRISLVLDAALEGQGVALTRSALATRDLLAGRLITLFDIKMSATFSYYMVHSKVDTYSEKIQRFKKWLLSEAIEEEKKYERLNLKGL